MSQTNDVPAEVDEHGETRVLTEEEGLESPAGDAVPESLEGQLEAAQAQAEENRAQYLRAMADLDNLRKRNQRELENARKYGLERLAGELLSVWDSLEAGLTAAEQAEGDPAALIAGSRATLKLLDAALAQFAIEVIDPHGEPFDPNYHEAMSMVDAPDTEPNTVVNVVQKGFRIHERLLRPARVLVSKSADG